MWWPGSGKDTPFHPKLWFEAVWKVLQITPLLLSVPRISPAQVPPVPASLSHPMASY